jgi:hypothetical protein
MLDPVSVALKFGFLVVLYLFLLWVVRSSLKDLRRSTSGAAAAAPPPDATGMHAAVEGLTPERGPDQDPRLRVERAAGLQSGSEFELMDEEDLVIGRGNQADIQIEDPYASTRHARIISQGELLVLEDLGSTNGTYLNDEVVRGPQPLHPGDRIRIGDNEFSFWD